ncbi:MAG: hypothetical protein LUF82_02585 [Clostridia bacterium]|nr:hypothetical protein [Clostridia bacterium]
MKNKLTLANIIVCAVLLVMAVLTIVGVCVNYISLSITLLGSTATDGYALGNEMLTGADGYGAMAAFAYITMALAILTLILYVVYKLFDIKVLKLVTLGAAALLVICAVVALILAFTFGGGEGSDWASYSVTPAVGAWLLFVGGILGGITGVTGALKC